MQQYKNDMDKIIVSDELKSKILAAADKKIKNPKTVNFRKTAAVAAGLIICVSVSGLMHEFVTSRNKAQHPPKAPITEKEQTNREKNKNITDDIILNEPSPETKSAKSEKNAEASAPRKEIPHSDNTADNSPAQATEAAQPSLPNDEPQLSEIPAPPQTEPADVSLGETDIPETGVSATPSESDYKFDESGLEKLRAEVGYGFAFPHLLPDGYVSDSLDLLFGTLIQLTYSNGEDTLTFRTEKYNGDISGDYTVYETTENVNINGADVTLRMNGDKCFGAVWQTDYAYALYSSAGLSKEQTVKIIENIRQ